MYVASLPNWRRAMRSIKHKILRKGEDNRADSSISQDQPPSLHVEHLKIVQRHRQHLERRETNKRLLNSTLARHTLTNLFLNTC